MTPEISGVLRIFCLISLLVSAPRVWSQVKIETPPPLDPVEAQREARRLVEALLAQTPEETATNVGKMIIQPTRATKSEVTVRFDTVRTTTNWSSVYETMIDNSLKVSRLVVIHTPGQPNQYLLSAGGLDDKPRVLVGNETMVPFAGSDFWVADLGFEFLFWPKQTLLKKEMRNNRFCEVLESTNPNPARDGYAKVLSWITAEKPHGPAHAEAYDAFGKKIKVFDPKSVEKVEGVYQLHSVEMRNLKTRSRTVLEFNSEAD